MTPRNDPTPRSATNNFLKIAGIAAVAALTLAVILLALGVFNFEQAGWFS